VIIINLNSGAYYSSDGAGEQIWQSLAHQVSPQEIVDYLCSLYPDEESAIRRDVPAFVQQLQGEDLIHENGATSRAAAEEGAWANRPAYASPVLHKYTDFEDLLKLDPIHEVHEAGGWPVAKPPE